MNPIEVDLAYQRLRQKLRSVATYRQKLELMAQFLDKLEGHIEENESYLLQLLQDAPAPDHPLNLTGCNPGWIETVRDQLQNLEHHLPRLGQLSEYRKLKSAIDLQLVAMLIWLGAWPRLEQIIGHRDPKRTAQFIRVLKQKHTEKGPINQKAWLQTLKELYGTNPESVRLINKWIRYFKNLTKGVHVPVVQQIQSPSNYAGRLRHMKLSINGPSREQRDILRSNFLVYGVEQTNDVIMNRVASAMRKLLQENDTGIHNSYVEGQLHFELNVGMPQGRSANLAAAGLFYCNIIAYLLIKDRYQFKNSVAITGDLNERGKVLEDDYDTLRPDIEAVFFSWIDYLILPESQKNRGRQIINQLQDDYPGKNLELIGVEKLAELFYDRRITRYKTLSGLSNLVRLANIIVNSASSVKL